MSVSSRNKISLGWTCPVCGPRRFITAIDHVSDQFACASLLAHTPRWHSSAEAYDARTTEKIVAPVDTRFPSRCPHCNRTAYVGLNVIEHADGQGCTPRSCK